MRTAWLLTGILTTLLAFGSGCMGTHKKLPDAPSKTRTKARRKDHRPEQRDGALARVQAVQTARALVGQRRVVISGQPYRSDCSGLVCAVYSAQGVQLPLSPSPTPRVSASQSIYLAAVEHYHVFKRGLPRPGDLVFFGNTYDANRDGRFNDDVTHMGLVESVENDGTVVILHFASGRVKRGRMNLAHPDVHQMNGKVLNDFLRRKRANDPRKARYLAGQLFVAYAAVLP